MWFDHGGEIAKWSDETDSWVYCTPVPGTIIRVLDIGEDTSTSGDGGDVIVDEDGNTTPAPWARSDRTYITESNESATLPDSFQLVAGDQIEFESLTDSSGNTLTIHNTAPTLIAGDNIVFETDTSGNTITIHGEAGGSGTGGGGGGGALEFIDETVLSGAAQEITVSGLDLSSDENYHVEISVKNATISDLTLSLYYNGDTTATNYYHDRITGDGGSIGGARSNTALLASNLEAGALARIATTLPIGLDLDGKARSGWIVNRAETTLFLQQQVIHRYQIAANITSLTVRSSTASSLASGSYIRVWRQGTGGGSGDTGGGGPIALDDLTDVAINSPLSQGDVLTYGTGGWSNEPPEVGSTSPLTTKGDVYTFDTDDQRLAVGANYDALMADSATATGLKWGVPAIPSNAQSGNYTIAATDRGRCIDHPSGAGSGDTYTIDSNTNLALEVGFTFSVFNMATDAVTVAITSDTLRKAGSGSTGSVSVPQYCVATFRKVATTTWLWFGVGAV